MKDIVATPHGDPIPPDGPGTALVNQEDVCALAAIRRIAAMLDLEPDDLKFGTALPRGWQFALLAADTRRSALRADGFPGLGAPIPDLGLPRLMIGGRKVTFGQDIPIGSTVMRNSAVRSIVRKKTKSGPIGVVTVAHELCIAAQPEPALIETQTYLLLPLHLSGACAPAAAAAPPIRSAHTKVVVPDETMLFQYSALSFNSHRIHLDRQHARDVEGFPDLVVNGGLSTLLLTEFLRNIIGVTPAAISVRYLAPLFCNRAITLAADRNDGAWCLRAFDDKNNLAVTMKVNPR